jgi:DNA repair protein RecN (Recombination protein N)
MLRELRIRDFTIIDDLSISFGEGFNVLTGETGAGKSIIVDALGLLLGEKASQDLIRSGCDEARVEAYFDPAHIRLLDDLSIDGSDGLILRRQLPARGKGRAYINDTSVSLQTIAAVGRELVDIHGQHEHQGLLKRESHLEIVDSFGGLSDDVSSFRSLYDAALELRGRIITIKTSIRDREQRMEYLRFQISEIDSAALTAGEKHALEEERAVLMNAGKLKESAETAYGLLYGAEGSALEQLSRIVNNVRDMSRIDRGAEESLALLQSAIPLVEDASGLLRKLKETYDIDPDRLTTVEERLDLIRKLEKKYGDGMGAILQYCERARDELRGLEHAGEHMEGLEKELAEKTERLSVAASALTKKRRAAAEKMSGLVGKELAELGFRKAELIIDIRQRDEICASGNDDIEFLFSANPGEPPRPLVRVASGGELSRIMLGLKCVEMGKDGGRISPSEKGSGRTAGFSANARTLIFDEVDAGIGGVTAQRVGARLGSLARDYQTLCITHLPQIAALADNHLKVDKEFLQNGVRVSVARVDGAARQEELARMLGGSITDRSLLHAEEMLGNGQKSYNKDTTPSGLLLTRGRKKADNPKLPVFDESEE